MEISKAEYYLPPFAFFLFPCTRISDTLMTIMMQVCYVCHPRHKELIHDNEYKQHSAKVLSFIVLSDIMLSIMFKVILLNVFYT